MSVLVLGIARRVDQHARIAVGRAAADTMRRAGRSSSSHDIGLHRPAPTFEARHCSTVA
jgi:hypothetical protein